MHICARLRAYRVSYAVKMRAPVRAPRLTRKAYI